MQPVKVVINTQFGGFSLSAKACRALFKVAPELIGKIDPKFGYLHDEISRHDPRLVAVVERLGAEANGAYADLMVCILRGRQYRIDEYDGAETLVEPEDYHWIMVP